MTQDYLENLVEVGNSEACEGTMIWFHGFGANNWSFEPSMKMLNLMLDGRLHIIIPNAPLVSNKRSWYPLPVTSTEGLLIEDLEGLKNAHSSINELHQKFKIDKCFVGGFSQGAALSLSLIFEDYFKIDGCVALSGYMPNADYYSTQTAQASPVFISHGKSDNAISYKSFEKSLTFLESKNIRPTKCVGNFGHTITKEVTNKMIQWFDEIL